jgi:hypothetical protein
VIEIEQDHRIAVLDQALAPRSPSRRPACRRRLVEDRADRPSPALHIGDFLQSLVDPAARSNAPPDDST